MLAHSREVMGDRSGVPNPDGSPLKKTREMGRALENINTDVAEAQ